MKKLNPPVGISHVTESMEDLYRDKLFGKTNVTFHPAAQPNSYPHLGTLTTLISTFALAKHLEHTLGIQPSVRFWELENAPGELRVINGQTYYKTLAKTDCNEGSKSEKYLPAFRDILSTYAALSQVPYTTWSYGDFQSISKIRGIILDLLEAEAELAPLLCPSENKFKVRFACPVCHLSSKKGGVCIETALDRSRLYTCYCPHHGVYEEVLSSANTSLFDINTPVRALAREIYLIQEAQDLGGQNMMSDGADWVHYAPLNIEALIRLGYPVDGLPARFFAPVITDLYGAKLAKSAQVGSNAYIGLPSYNLNSTELEKTFGRDVHTRLWNEISSWIKEPKKIFRNYSITYLSDVLGMGQ